jgi:hypothetical protein
MKVDIKTLQSEPPKLFQEKYQEWAEHACDYEWWDGVYDNFVEDMKEHGVDVSYSGASRAGHCIYFSLSYSQGDYAAFDGTLDMPTWMEKHGYKTKYFPLWLDMQDYGARATIKSRRNCCAQSLDYSPGNCRPSNIFEGMDEQAWDDLVTTMFEAEDWDKLLDDWLRDTCQKLYKDLQEEYEYLTSEAQFIEAMCDEVFEVDTEEEVV